MKYTGLIVINKNVKFLFFIIIAIAIIPALLLVLFKNSPIPPESDAADYHQIAIGLLEGKGFHSNASVADVKAMPNGRHPLYPLFIAIIYLFTNRSLIAVKIAQILMYGLTCVIIFLISEELVKNKFKSFAAGIIWALYPLAAFHSTFLLSETFFTFLLALCIWSILKFSKKPSLKNCFFSSFFLGLAALTKSLILAFVPVLFIWLVLFSRDKLIWKLKNLVTMTLFIILTISPWLIRNYIVLKGPFPLATEGGISFYRYNNEKTLEVVYTPLRIAFPFTEEQKKYMSTLSEPEADKYFYRLAWQFIKSHPRDFLKLKLTELCFFWRLWPAHPKRFSAYYSQTEAKNIFLERFKSSYLLYLAKIFYHLPYNILFIGMFVSIIGFFKKDRTAWKKFILLALLIATINIVYIFFHGTDRFRMPIDPYVFILGIHGVIFFHNGLKRRSNRT